MKGNTKVHLPKPLPTQYEAKIAVRREKWEEVRKEYIKENCQEDGTQKSNLTPAQQRGIKKLRKRTKDGELLVVSTDKSGKLAVVSVENYIKMGELHTSKDKEVNEEKAKELQRVHNGHVSMWLKITNMGENWNHCDRIRENCINHSCSVAAMYLLVKDHKPTNPGELPATRPVCSGCNSMGVHLSNILSEIIDAIANSMKGSMEVISTEDLLYKIDEFNKLVDKENEEKTQQGNEEREEKIAINGADATGLYPNLEGRQGGRLVRDAYLESDLTIEGVNYKEAARYVAMKYDAYEVRKLGLERIIPKRRFKHGTKPGVTGKEPLSKESDDEVRWEFPEREPSDLEKRKLLAACLEIGVRCAFASHLYQFGGRTYHQKDGGPIGTRLSGSVARIVMIEWGRRLLTIMNENKIKVWLAAFYVDDVRLVTSLLEKGVRWDNKEKKFVRKVGWQEEDEKENINEMQRTAREIRKAMNSIFMNIQFTMEIPEDFSDKRLPTLDFSCWVENVHETGDSQGENCRRSKILYSFYEKPMNSPFCILENSALSDSTKISSLSQEVIRRMMNTHEQVPQAERNTIIERFITKLRLSGYRKDQVENIISAGLKGYEKKLEKCQKSGKDLHRSARTTEGLRYRKKLMEKSNWFKQRKGEQEKNGERNGAVKSKPGDMKGYVKKEKRKENSPISVLFVPKTPGGELARRLRQAETELEALTGDKVKIVEKAGTMVKRILTKSNLWAGGQCGRQECLVCSTEGGGDCRRRNVTYKTQCLLCKEKGGECVHKRNGKNSF